MAIQVQYRRGTAAEWTAANPVLAEGEPGYETDTGKFKVGTGTATWSALSYSSGPKGDTGAPGAAGAKGDQGDPTTVNGKTGASITLTASDVGADPAGTASSAVSAHVAASDPHGDRAYADSTFIPATQKGAASGVASLGTDGKVPSGQLPSLDYVPLSQKGAASGVATLDGSGKVPSTQLPAMDYEASGTAASAVSAHVAASDPHGDRAYTDSQVSSLSAAAATTYAAKSVRATVSVTTASLDNDASANATFALGKAYRLLAVTTDKAARVRLYTTTAARTADASRAVGWDPDWNAGVTLDFVSTSTALSGTFSPLVDGASAEATPSIYIPATITNLSGSTGTVTVTFTYLVQEA